MLCVALTTEASAAPRTCPAIAGGNAALAELDVEARLAFVRQRLAHDARAARRWSFGFGTSYAIGAAGALTYGVAVRDRGKKADVFTGGTGAIIGLSLLTFAPLSVEHDHVVLEDEVARFDPAADRCLLLARAEALLVRDAKNEKFNRGWFTHTGNALIGVASFLVLGLGFRRWVPGTINGLGSIAIGELMIALQPAGLIRDLRAYRAGDLRPPPRRRRRRRRRRR